MQALERHRWLRQAGARRSALPLSSRLRGRSRRQASFRSRRTQQLIVCYAADAVGVGVLERPAEAEAAWPLPLPRAVENIADDPSIHNPLERLERLSTGWFGVIAEYEGVVVDDTVECHVQAWLRVADEMGYPRPLGQALRRIKGMRDEAVIMQLFAWTRAHQQVSAIAARKQAIYEEIMNGATPAELPGSRAFFDTLRNHKIPVALATASSDATVRPALQRLNLSSVFDTVVTCDDMGAAETELYYLTAAGALQRPPARCIVVGDNNKTVEAAHELGMKSVILTGSQPAWNFANADLVVRSLDQLSFVNMKNLFGREGLVEPQWEYETEEQELMEERGARFL